MYYPKSQIQTNLYTNGGELIYFDTKQEYKGYYYKTSKSQFFSGKTPDDKPNNLLIPLIDNEINNNYYFI